MVISVIAVVFGAATILAGSKTDVSFKKDIQPIIKKNCMPCHAEDQFNPSELFFDSYDLLIEGGKHGPPVVAGKSKESLLMQKLGPNPPFGDSMPLDPKKKKGEPNKKRLTDEEMKLIADWIDQGAKNN
jgi:hypothetical protein